MKISVSTPRKGHRYWAFLSYSRTEARQARSLHRRLERFGVPRPLRSSPAESRLPKHHLRPIFRDEAEMAASGALDERLRDAIDESAAMVLLASQDSARSHYVDLEVAHFVATRGLRRLVIVAVGEGGRLWAPLPPALRNLPEEPLWVDCRDEREPNRRALVRIAAAVLDVGFDALWGRHRRRRRKVLVAWSALAATLAAVVGLALWQQNLAERRTPERQAAIFREWYGDKLGVGADELDFTIARNDDLDDDGWTDYIVDNETPGYCGSGGCGTEVYMTRAPGDYHQVLFLLGNSTPRVRASSTGPDQIISTDLTVSREPLYSVHSFVGDRYRRTSYEFCDGVLFERCSPVVIAPVPHSDSLKVAPGTVLRERPDLASRPVTVGAKGTQNDFSPADATVEGVLPDRQWYLVDQWKGTGGFVPASAVHR